MVLFDCENTMLKFLLNGFFLLITLNVCSNSIQSRVAETSDAVSPNAETVLHRLADFYRRAETLEVESRQTIHVTTGETDECMSSRCAIQAARPNRISIHSEQGTTTLDLVSDGETLVTWVPNLDQYSETTAPDSFESLLQNRQAVRAAQFVLHLLTDAPYETLMEGVTTTGYVGREQLGGTDVHHLHFVQHEVAWDAWVQAEGDPLLLQVSVDMSGALRNVDGQRVVHHGMTITETFQNWRINSPLSRPAFRCVRPQWAGNTDGI